MRVLHLGGTGNLGVRIIPALLSRQHSVVAYVRSTQKLLNLLPADIANDITVVQGDALDTDAIAEALRKYECDAVVNTAGTRQPRGQEQTLGKIATAVTTAAIKVGQERQEPLRAILIGGMGSLRYPGTPYKIQQYMPGWLTEHHRGTEAVMRDIRVEELRWTLVCVAMMFAESEELLLQTREPMLAVGIEEPPCWEDHWIRGIPLIGRYLNLVPTISSYRTKLEDVAAMIAVELAVRQSRLEGSFVGFKPVSKGETSSLL